MARPNKYTIEEATRIIEDYFASTDRPTTFGLCNALDMDRHTLLEWAQGKHSGFSALARKCVYRIGDLHEKNLWLGKTAYGSIHWLKCHGMNVPEESSKLQVESRDFKVSFRTAGKDGNAIVV